MDAHTHARHCNHQMKRKKKTIPASLMRAVFLDAKGKAAPDGETRTLCALVERRVALTGEIEARTRASFAVTDIPADSPTGSTRPHLADLIVLQIGARLYQSYRVEQTQATDSKLAANELLLSHHSLFFETIHG